ncbi:unnamed protein product [Phytophthora lilii]|uniref:Unnamed protein product n=1 Tax=Phytophthora lilii TaxID=2077276 RepID=A0A9W6WPP5_9STRA|nr:unnamed protein product [Phytophthora lilii]
MSSLHYAEVETPKGSGVLNTNAHADKPSTSNLAPLADLFSILDNIRDASLLYVYVGIAVFLSGCLQVACWSITAARQSKHRGAYVKAILTKEIGWFDVNDPMQLPSRVAETPVKIQEGMGRKVGDGIHYFSTAVSGIVIGLVKGWGLALVVMALMPFIAFTAFFSMKQLSKDTQTGIDAYGEAGAIAQESLSNVRTVHAFNSIEHFAGMYEQALHSSTKAGIKNGFAVGWGTGVMFFTVFCTYALGWTMVRTKSTVIRLREIAQALGVTMVVECKTLDKVAGRIGIENVTFAYPTRPGVRVCHNYSLTLEDGETVALFGPSGSGKNAIVSHLERFYDPLGGTVCIDGEDIQALNVKWLKKQVGLVGQEPALFATSIMENNRYGYPSATDQQVIEAAKMANAYDFIQAFPQGFATEVGERGTQLSGGQKQRIAIARAIIKNPPILLLDEATSALNTESERVVQESLDKLLSQAVQQLLWHIDCPLFVTLVALPFIATEQLWRLELTTS